MQSRALSLLPPQTRKEVTAELTALLTAKYGWPENHVEVTEADIEAFQPTVTASQQEIDEAGL